MPTVNIHDAKSNLSKLLRSVQAGETVVIAKYGQPIADLVPHQPVKSPVIFGLADGKIKYQDKQLVGTDPYIQKMFYGNE